MTTKMRINGFAVDKTHIDTEEKCVHLYAMKHHIPYKYFGNYKDVPDGWLPVGTIEWFLKCTGLDIKASGNNPDYADNYPSFLKPYLNRNLFISDKWPDYKVFIKPADKLKRFNGFVTDGTYKHKKKPPFFISDIVSFKDEWRYYISNGKVVGIGWYAGESETSMEEPVAPDISQLGIDYPKNWCGSIDFGIEKNRGLTLIEAHPPFAVGNYLGLGSDVYAEWLINGYLYLMNTYNKGS
ncbi:MAG: ATP-grasp domain-containing protein [Clostridia bacterium]|nr:ATP-grasp domain-containing protein [Clostridia bacterium]